MDGSTRALLVSVLASLGGLVIVGIGFATRPGELIGVVLVMVMAMLLVVTLASAFVAGFLYAPPLPYGKGDIRWGSGKNDERWED